MKKCKKIMALFMSLIMIVMSFSAVLVTSFAEGASEFVVSATEAGVGEEITVTVGADNMVGLKAASIAVYYDADCLEYVSVSQNIESDAFATGDCPETGRVAWGVMWATSASYDQNLVDITFVVLQEGSTNITVSVYNNDWDGTDAPSDMVFEISTSAGDSESVTGEVESIPSEIATGESASGEDCVHFYEETEYSTGSCEEKSYGVFCCIYCGEEYTEYYDYGHIDEDEDGFCDLCNEDLVSVQYDVTFGDAFVGEEVTITVGIVNMNNVGSADLLFYYDSEYLEYVSVTNLGESDVSAVGGCPSEGLVTWSFMTGRLNGDYEFVNITFKVLKAGTTELLATNGSWEGIEAPADLYVEIVAIERAENEDCSSGHTPSDEFIVTEPTCTEDGYTEYTCSVCGDTYIDDYTDALGHTPDGEGVVTEPTCTQQGYTTYHCSVCGEDYNTDYTAAHHTDEDDDLVCDNCGTFVSAIFLSATDAAVGEIVTVTVSAVGFAGFEAGTLRFDFDPEHLEYIDISGKAPGATFTGGLSVSSNSTVSALWMYVYSATEDSCDLCEITFRVLTDGASEIRAYVSDWEGVPAPDEVTMTISTSDGVAEEETTTEEPTTVEPTTSEPTTSVPETTTAEPTTAVPETTTNAEETTTSLPETTTEEPTTEEPTTEEPTTEAAEIELNVKADSDITVDNENKQATITDGLSLADILAQLENENVTILDSEGNELAADALVGTGCVVNISINISYTVIVPADIDGNGKISAADARLTLRSSAKIDTLEDVYSLAADFDGNNKITAADARMILRKSAKLAE